MEVLEKIKESATAGSKNPPLEISKEGLKKSIII